MVSGQCTMGAVTNFSWWLPRSSVSPSADHADSILNAEKIIKHFYRFLGGQDDGLRCNFTKGAQRSGVVGFHVIDDQVINFGGINQRFQGSKIVFLENILAKVDQNGFGAFDQIGVVGNAFLFDRPQAFKKFGPVVIDADPEDVITDLNWLHIGSLVVFLIIIN